MRKRAYSLEDSKMLQDLKISVIIIAKNAEKTIPFTLNSLLNQVRKADEIIVVDDSSTDNTPLIAKQYGAKVVLNTFGGCGGGRRIGVEHARGDIVAFIDADEIAHPEWLYQVESIFKQRKDLGAQGGPVITIGNIEGLNMGKIGKEGEVRIVKYVHPGNLAVWRKVAIQIGNFDERLRIGGEGLDFCWRLNEAGYKIVYNPKMTVYHLKHPMNFKRLIKNARAQADLLRKYALKYKSWSIIALGHAFFITTSILLLVIGYPLLSLIILSSSLAHRTYKVFSDLKMGVNLERVALSFINNFFVAYLSYFIFVINIIRGGIHVKKVRKFFD